MRILFLHNNFPAQFGFFGQYLQRNGCEVYFGTNKQVSNNLGINIARYKPHREVNKETHPYQIATERAVLNGQAAARMGLGLKKKGFNPDVIVAHSGWGPGLYMKDVWPDSKFVGFYEWYYNSPGADYTFLNKYPPSIDHNLSNRTRNTPLLMDLAQSDIGLCPTEWQKKQFPSVFQPILVEQHDGIDTNYFRPSLEAKLELPGLTLTSEDEVITYVARGMEPYRGFPQFMKALAKVQKRRPKMQTVVVGDDRVAYGKKLKEGDSHKKRALETLDLDMSRIHFTGILPRNEYRTVLQISSVHIYLTIPFVLSWSMLEAMSTGCLLVASDTEPVREVIFHGQNGVLVNFHETQDIVEKICGCLELPERFREFRLNARQSIVSRYSFDKIYPEKKCLLENVCSGNLSRNIQENSTGSAKKTNRLSPV